MSNNFYTFNEYMKDKNLSISEEDYLEMIYRLCLKTKYTRVNDLANSLNVKPPSVSNMIKRLQEKELIIHADYGIIELTKKGRMIGKVLLDRHLSVERFLTIIQIKSDLLKETEKIEHTLSQDTLEAINKLVQFFDDFPDILSQFNQYIK